MHHRYFKLAPENDNGSTGGAGSGGAQNASGGASGGNQQSGNNQGGEGGDAGGAGDANRGIKPEDHQRALDDLHKFKAEAKKNADALAKLSDEMKQLKTQGLKSSQDYKTYAEQLETENVQLKEERDNLKKGIAGTFRHMEVKAAATKLGITERAMPDLDLIDFADSVEVEFTTGGRAIVKGANEAAEMLKKTRPHWFSSGAAANINTGGKGSSEPQELSTAYMNDLEKKDPKKYKELFPKYAKQLAARKR